MSVNRQAFTLSGVASYPATPQAIIPWQSGPKSITVISNDNDCFVSLDGTNDHAYLIGNGNAIKFSQFAKKVWLRNGTAPSVNIQVIAEK